jgi:hypothetical protein
MAAKKKSSVTKRKAVAKAKPVTGRPKPARKGAVGHADTTARLHELILRCTALQDSGQLSQARKLYARVEQLQKALQAMEEAIHRAGSDEQPKKGAS